MMSRQTFIALVTCGLLAAWGLLSLNDAPERGISRVDYTKIDTAALDKIILSGAHSAELIKTGEAWTFKTRAVNKDFVKQLLDAAQKIRSSDLITQNTSQYGDYEIDDTKGTQVTLGRGGDKVAEFSVGKAASGGVHIKVEDAVYAVKGVFAHHFKRDGVQWLDKKVFQHKSGDFESVEVTLGGQAPYRLEKKEGQWTLANIETMGEGFRFDKAVASRLVNSLSGLRAKDILLEAPDAATTKLDSDFDEIKITLKGAQAGASAISLKVGAEKADDSSFYVRSSSVTDLMTVSASTVKGLLKMPRDFRDLKVMQFNSAQVKEAKWVNKKKSLVLSKKEGKWTRKSGSQEVPDDFELDSQVVEQRLRSLANLRALGVLEEKDVSLGLGRLNGQVELTLTDDSVVALKFGRESNVQEKDVWVAQGNADELYYGVVVNTAQNALGLLNTFRKRAPPPTPPGAGGLANIDPSMLSKLPPDIRKNLEEQIRQQQQKQALVQKLQEQTP
jgi:hypothetical protein